MRRLLGFLLVIHGLAHSGAGMWATRSAPTWVTTTLWLIATTGFVLAGGGLLGAPRLDVRWRLLAAIAATASLALVARFWHPVLMIGAAIDAAILVDCIPFAHEIIARRIGLPIHPARHRLARPLTIVVLLLAVYPAGLILLRPWYTVDDSTTRLIVRTRGEGTPSLAAVALAPVGLMVFEPAHFIMQRGMLLGIKKRAERTWGMTPVP